MVYLFCAIASCLRRFLRSCISCATKLLDLVAAFGGGSSPYRRRFAAVALFLGMFFCGPGVQSWARQSAPPAAPKASPAAPLAAASLYGTVVGPGGAVLAGAKLTLSGTVARTATSRSDGGFAFKALPAGVYRLTAAGPGMKSVTIRHIVLGAGAIRFLPQIVLWVNASTTVRVAAPTEALA